jgi:Superfamily II helicase
MDTKAIFSSLPENLRTILKDTGINDLYPPQAEAVHKGLLTDKNMLLSMPTASGKTLMAELVMLKTIFSKKGNCLYIVPLRALASEKYDDFKEKYAALGITVGIATGDFDGFDGSLTQNDIMIATAEKIDSLLRQKPAWLCSRLACVVVDEIHYIGDPTAARH